MFGNPSYPTYQAFLGLGIAAAIALLLMPWWIKLLKVEGIGQQVRADGPKRHLIKQGTPTMGGVIILVAISLTCLLMGKLTTELVLVLLATLATGVLGLIDDLTSVTHGRSLGLTPHAKMIGLTIICVTFTVLAVNWCGVAPEIRFPGGLTIDLGVLSTTICGLSFPWLYIVFCWLMIAGLSNAVNLTDGLDGLAGGTSMIAMLAMAAMAFLHGDVNLSIFCTACAGACLGFLWFNCYPASIFMGDTGSPGCRFCLHLHHDQHRSRFPHHRRSVYRRDPVGHDPGCLFPLYAQARLPYGAHSSSFRKEGLGRDQGRYPFLDYRCGLWRRWPRPVLPVGIVVFHASC